MKPATNDTSFIYDEDNFIGINLGWDFTAEHECGIKEIKDRFGISNKSTFLNKKFGVETREVTKIPNELFFAPTIYKKKKCFVLAAPIDGTKKYLPFNDKGVLLRKGLDVFKLLMWRLVDEKSSNIVASWDEKSFAICVINEEKDKLKELYDAFLNKDVVIMFNSSDNPYANSGLCIFIKSKLPNSFLQNLYDVDEKQYKLEKEVKKTKIEEKLKKANKKYFSLSPKWNEDGTIIYWLNPYDQRKYNMGWYTLDDLLLWIKDKGPIVKNN